MKFIVKIFAFLLFSAVLLVCVNNSGTLAYLHAKTNSVTNEFNPSKVEIDIIEDFENGDAIKENVQIKNTGNVPVYVRVKIIVQAQNENGDVIAKPVLKADQMNFREIRLDDFYISNIENWTKTGDYYYYTKLLKPNESALLFQTAKLKETVVFEEDYTPILSIVAQAVQENAVDQAWENR